jgi:hypothetical protein
MPPSICLCKVLLSHLPLGISQSKIFYGKHAQKWMLEIILLQEYMYPYLPTPDSSNNRVIQDFQAGDGDPEGSKSVEVLYSMLRWWS